VPVSSNVEAVEKPHFTEVGSQKWRDLPRAICHFTVELFESPYRQRAP
jgi:hypothetical protein